MGDWMVGKAEPVDEAASHHLDELFNRKYGVQKRLMSVVARIRGRNYLLYAIRLVHQTP